MKAPNRNGIIAAGSVALAAALVIGSLSAAPATQPAGPDPLPTLTTSPKPSSKSTLLPVPYRPVLPPAVVSHDPRLVPADKSHPLLARPAIDLPPLSSAAPPLPADEILPAGPAVRVASSDPAALPVATIAEKSDTGRPSLLTDPTAGLAQSGATVIKPPPRTIPPPAQLLTIPDPSHQPGFVPTPAATMEDAPVVSLDRPGPTTLPVTGK